MFPWGNNTDNNNPLESLFKRPSSFQLPSDNNNNIQNPILSNKQDDFSSPFFSNFPSPFFDERELPLNQILPQYLLMAGNNNHNVVTAADQTKNNMNPSEYSTKKGTSTSKRVVNGASSKSKQKGENIDQTNVISNGRRRNPGVVAPRKRTGKKDRHSKICTAQGIRDRRMRLSLQIARKFFDLQDILGYDKASKTIEWLFNKSKKAIKELTKDIITPQDGNTNNNISISTTDAKSESFLSECEVMSGIEENSNNEIKEGIILNQSPLICAEKKSASKSTMKESREKARARARCRTREKMMIKQNSSPNNHQMSGDVQKLGSFSNGKFEGRPDQEPVQERVSSYLDDDKYYHPSIVHQFGGHDMGTIEKLLGSSSSSSAISNCPIISDNYCSGDTSFMGFLGNWEMLNNDRLNSSSSQQYSVLTNQQQHVSANLQSGIPSSVNYASAADPDFLLFHQ